MRLFVDGVLVFSARIDRANRPQLRLEVEPGGEECGPITLVVSGGVLDVLGTPEQNAALTVRSEGDGQICLIGHQSADLDFSAKPVGGRAPMPNLSSGWVFCRIRG